MNLRIEPHQFINKISFTQSHWIVKPIQPYPQITAAITMGRNSMTAMEVPLILSFNGYWNHSRPHKAAQPHLPAASDHRNVSGLSLCNTCSIDTPFHGFRKVCHHARSDLNELLNLIWWCSSFATVDYKIILRKQCPGLTTLQAWCSWQSGTAIFFLTGLQWFPLDNQCLKPLQFCCW